MTQKHETTTTEWEAISGAAMIIGAVLLIVVGFYIGGCRMTWEGAKADVHRWTAPEPDGFDNFLATDGDEHEPRVPKSPSPWL